MPEVAPLTARNFTGAENITSTGLRNSFDTDGAWRSVESADAAGVVDVMPGEERRQCGLTVPYAAVFFEETVRS